MSFIPFAVNEQIRISCMYSLFAPDYPCGYTFAGESHNFWECLYVSEGDVSVSADERVYNLSEGEIIFHKPLELHKFYIDNPRGARLIIFSFSAEGDLCEFLKDKVFKLSPMQRNILASMLSYAEEHVSELSPAPSGEGYNDYLLPFSELPYYSQTMANFICRLCLSLADGGRERAVSNDPESKVFREAIKYMKDRVVQNPSVLDIARACNTSESGIKRIFEKYAGIGVHKYFLKLKFKAAAELLADGLSVSAVAENLGFCSQAYFTKAFKREMGLSPSEYKTKSTS